MLQLTPREKFYIVRQLEDSSDTNTYYIKSVIRDGKTDDVIDTVYLESKGTQRFSKVWEVCPDPSGRGRFISITSYVYSDSGYTTLSSVYAARSDTYLVEDRWNRVFGIGGGGEISYKKIQEIIKEEIQKIEKPKETDLSELFSVIKNISFPDIQPILEGNIILQKLLIEIKNKEYPKTDLSVLIKLLEEIKKKEIDLSSLENKLIFLTNTISSLRERAQLIEEEPEGENKKLSDLLHEALGNGKTKKRLFSL